MNNKGKKQQKGRDSFIHQKVDLAGYQEQYVQTTLTQLFPTSISFPHIASSLRSLKQNKIITPDKKHMKANKNKKKDDIESIESVVGCSQEHKLTDSHTNEQVEDDFQTFNFKDYNEGSQYDVVISAEGDTVPITAPKTVYYQQPREGFLTHHLCFGCESTKDYERTIIPTAGMYDFYFMKRYIRTEHEKLNGKLNAWRIELLEALDKVVRMRRVLQTATFEQEHYARYRVMHLQKEVLDFDLCCISLLNKDAIEKVVSHGA